MNDTGTIAHGNVGITGHEMSLFVLLCSGFCCTCIEGFVFLVLQILTGHGLQNFVCLLVILCQSSENLVQECFCHVIGITVCCLDLAVSLIRVDTKCNVGWQCPRGRCPCQEISIFAYDLETNDGRTLLNQLVALCYFLRGKRRAATRAVRHDLEALVK